MAMRLGTVLAIWIMLACWQVGWAQQEWRQALSDESRECVVCHSIDSPNINQQWAQSQHYSANVGCYECHSANESDPDAFEHEGRWVSVLVTPNDCAQCHATQVNEFNSSSHANAGQFHNSNRHHLAVEVMGNRDLVNKAHPEGTSAIVTASCNSCHGTQVRMQPDGKPVPETWPTTGIGRINPDGSKGNCSSCHQHHVYSVQQARQSETCAACHAGPDYQHYEIVSKSRHGLAYQMNRASLDFSHNRWAAGLDYQQAPSCTTCHLGANAKSVSIHQMGYRLKWNHQGPISRPTQKVEAQRGVDSNAISTIERESEMKAVCSSCHQEQVADRYYENYDAVLELYHEKFANPGYALYQRAVRVMKEMNEGQIVLFAQPLDFTWHNLWNAHGRRLRFAAAHDAPDVIQHEFSQIAELFYHTFLPQLREVAQQAAQNSAAKDSSALNDLNSLMEEVMASPNHQWYSKGQ